MLINLRAHTQDYFLEIVHSDIASSLRGLSVVNDKVAWVSGSNGMVGVTHDGGLTWSLNKIPGYETYDFRTLYAFNEREAVIASAGSPAYILLTSNGGSSWKIAYENHDPEIFFDGADFWDDQHGLLYGDPINNRMVILETANGGELWQLKKEQSRPPLLKGEASFAASGTGIRCYETNKVVVATGGEHSRLWLSMDCGESWSVKNVPILQGKSSTGIFSVAIDNNNEAIVVGGNYLIDTLKLDHILFTRDWVSWKVPAIPTGGYRECVEFIDESIAMATGPTGTDLTIDGGTNWKRLSEERGFHVLRKARKGNLIVIAGNNKIGIIRKKE